VFLNLKIIIELRLLINEKIKRNSYSGYHIYIKNNETNVTLEAEFYILNEYCYLATHKAEALQQNQENRDTFYKNIDISEDVPIRQLHSPKEISFAYKVGYYGSLLILIGILLVGIAGIILLSIRTFSGKKRGNQSNSEYY